MEHGSGFDMALRLALALGIGLLVGVERGRHTRKQSGGARIAGVRTYSLIGILGGVWGMLGVVLGDVVLGFAFLGFAALVMFAYRFTANHDGDRGMTSEIAALLVFALGALAVRGDMALAAGGGVVTAALLDAKTYMHRWVSHLENLELDAAIKLLIISVVVLPVLPNRGFGPDGIFNPYTLWWMVVIIAGISFAGYITIKKIGPRVGGLMTGMFGGLASSTALTLGFAELGRKSPSISLALAGGISASSAVMFVRVIAVVSVFNPSLVAPLAPPMLAMAVASIIGSVVMIRLAGNRDTDETVSVGNPCDISSALKFGIMLGVIIALAYYARKWLGEAGVFAVAAISGFVDVDAISLSMAEQAGSGLSLQTASVAIITAVAVNTVFKVVLVGSIAGRKMALPLGAITAMVITAGIGGILLF